MKGRKLSSWETGEFVLSLLFIVLATASLWEALKGSYAQWMAVVAGLSYIIVKVVNFWLGRVIRNVQRSKVDGL